MLALLVLNTTGLACILREAENYLNVDLKQSINLILIYGVALHVPVHFTREILIYRVLTQALPSQTLSLFPLSAFLSRSRFLKMELKLLSRGK